MKVTGKQSQLVLNSVTQTLFFTQTFMASDVILKEDVVIHRDRRLTITHLGVAMQ